MPLHDWQFYTVTLLALLGLGWMLRPLFRRGNAGSDHCGNCASGSAASRAQRKHVSLTIEQRRI
jgi:hypothetical protein